MSQRRINPRTGQEIHILNPRQWGSEAFPLRQSDISTILPPFGCIRKWFLQVREYNSGRPTREFRDPRTVRGTVLHSTIDIVHRERCFGRIARVYLEEWRREERRPDEPPIRWDAVDGRREYIKAGYELVKGYFDDPENRDAEVLAQEAKFVCRVGRFTAVGCVDQVRRDGDGIRLVDFKSGQIGTQFDLDHSFQLALYSLALLDGTFTMRNRSNGDSNPETLEFRQWPKSLGLIRLLDYQKYDKPTPKQVRYVSEAEYYGVPIGETIKPLTPKNEDGHPKLQPRMQRGPGFYRSQMSIDSLDEFVRSVTNIVATVRMSRYWWANHSMACSGCAYQQQCRGQSTESGHELADLNLKSSNRRRI